MLSSIAEGWFPIVAACRVAMGVVVCLQEEVLKSMLKSVVGSTLDSPRHPTAGR